MPIVTRSTVYFAVTKLELYFRFALNSPFNCTVQFTAITLAFLRTTFLLWRQLMQLSMLIQALVLLLLVLLTLRPVASSLDSAALAMGVLHEDCKVCHRYNGTRHSWEKQYGGMTTTRWRGDNNGVWVVGHCSVNVRRYCISFCDETLCTYSKQLLVGQSPPGDNTSHVGLLVCFVLFLTLKFFGQNAYYDLSGNFEIIDIVIVLTD